VHNKNVVVTDVSLALDVEQNFVFLAVSYG